VREEIARLKCERPAHWRKDFAPRANSTTAATKPPRTIFLTASMPQPERISGENPVYSDHAKAKNIEGLVVLLFTIAADGSVTNVRLLKDLPILGKICQEAVKSWKFKPILSGGSPISVIMKQPFQFNLQD